VIITTPLLFLNEIDNHLRHLRDHRLPHVRWQAHGWSFRFHKSQRQLSHVRPMK
jgi:hypothetical protein